MPIRWLNRRAFLRGLGCTFALAKLSAADRSFSVRRVREYSGSGIALPAIAAACMPETLVIAQDADGEPIPMLMYGRAGFMKSLDRSGFVELRRYDVDREDALARMENIFSRHGIRPLLRGTPGTFLFGFSTLASREKVWRELNAKPEWLKMGARLGDLAIYEHRPPPIAQIS